MNPFARLFILLLLLLSVSVAAAQSETLPYQDPTLSVEERVADLLERMTLEEKIGQMTQVERGSIMPTDVARFFIGSVLSGGGGYPPGNNTVEGWAQMINAYQEAAIGTRLAIPVIYGVDAVHGHNNLSGAVIFPHNIGLGAARNPELVAEIGRITAAEMLATGSTWNFSPVLAVPQDIRWGRTYEGYSENTELVTELSTAMLLGLQGETLSDAGSVLGTPKHYVGDGGTTFGSSRVDGAYLDQGATEVDEATLRAVHLAPYFSAVENGARSIMVSFSSWDGIQMHAHEYLIQDVLRGELGFTGFIVSDWGGMDYVAPEYYDAVVQSINAGVDMNMVPYDYQRFISTMLTAVENGDISMERIDEAVANILRVKFEMGLFERPYADETLQALVGSDEHRAVARDAVSQSLVLLKNENEALPLDAGASQTVYIAGAGADSLGMMSGGWSIEWQGFDDNRLTQGTTILSALQEGFGENTTVVYEPLGRFDDARADVGIVVIGERPYAEYMGDDADLAVDTRDVRLVASMREKVDKLIVVLLSGRPLIIDGPLADADAFVAAWLPGTEGAGVADVLFGDRDFVGRLSFTWPRSVDQLPFDFASLPTEGCEAPLFPFGYGLTYENNQSEWLNLAVECAVESAEAEAEAEAELPEVPALETVEGQIAPHGVFGETYYAPFPVSITLDGDLSDWAGVPRVGLSSPSGSASILFAAAADAEFLYLSGHVNDANIISGEHGTDYWNEDSIEFYINATGDLTLTAYTDGVAQVTIPALNADQPETPVIAGVRGSTVNAQVAAARIETGYAVEVALPLENDVWSITPEHEGVIGFQVHLNGAASGGRDTKLIWSVWDSSDQSYVNPSLFGELIFFEVGQEMPEGAGEAAAVEPTPIVEVDDSVTWESREWELVWSDEFEGEAGTPINSEYWTHDIGGQGWGNNEFEYYTDRVENASLDGSGNLAIVAREEALEGQSCWYGACTHTSARIITQDKVEFTYGRVEARIKVPRGQGIWPAFWMLGADFNETGWPGSGEIDIMEVIGKEPRTVYNTIHGPGYSGAGGIGSSHTVDAELADDFHVFAVDWDPNVIRWYFDGELINTISANDLNGREWVFNHDFFILLNVAVGGNWPGNPDETTEFPQTMLVDYVRVYQLAEGAGE